MAEQILPLLGTVYHLQVFSKSNGKKMMRWFQEIQVWVPEGFTGSQPYVFTNGLQQFRSHNSKAEQLQKKPSYLKEELFAPLQEKFADHTS